MNLKKYIRQIIREEFLKEDVGGLILYHASNELFDKFELRKGYRTHLFSVELTDAHAIFLTPDVEATKQFGEKYLYKCKIHPKRTLDWREHLDVRSYEWFKKQFGNIIPWNASEYWMLLDDKRVIDYLHHRGIDCIIISEIGEHDPFDTYAMLNLNSIEIIEVVDLKKQKLSENQSSSNQEYITYHSSNSKIDDFDFDKIELKPNSSTRIDGIFFSNIPQTSWGNYIYKVKLISQNPAIFDLSKSRFDSLGVQEAFDALLRGETSYIIEDLVEYGGMEQEDAENLAEEWRRSDLIVITNQVYGKHDTEYIVPDPYYNGKSAQIINLGLIKK